MIPYDKFIWSIKSQECLTWFKTELEELFTHPNINITLHSTRLSSPILNPSSPLSNTSTPPNEYDEKAISSPISVSSTSSNNPFSNTTDPEKAIELSTPGTSTPRQYTILQGRPDIKTAIENIVSTADREDRIAIAACGPDGMMATVRKTAAGCVRVDGPSVELYCEQFGW